MAFFLAFSFCGDVCFINVDLGSCSVPRMCIYIMFCVIWCLSPQYRTCSVGQFVVECEPSVGLGLLCTSMMAGGHLLLSDV
jgi:hypothetical protein